MRGRDDRSEGLFSYVSCERRLPANHPLRAILPIVDAALAALSGEFEKLYAVNGRPSIPPEKLLPVFAVYGHILAVRRPDWRAKALNWRDFDAPREVILPRKVWAHEFVE